MVVSQLALAHETDQLVQGCTVKLYTRTVSEETEQHGEPKLRIKIRKGDKDDFIDLAEPFSNTSPLS